MRSRVGCTVGVILALCGVARPSAAQLIYYKPNPEPVDVWLTSPLPNAELQIYAGNQRPGHVAPMVVCFGQCAFKLVPGEYRVLIDAPPGADVHRSSRRFDLSGPSAVTVEPPSSSAHWGGLALGIAGPIVMGFGAALLLGDGFGMSETNRAGNAVGGALLFGGVGVTVGGWLLFAANAHPSVQVAPVGAPGR